MARPRAAPKPAPATTAGPEETLEDPGRAAPHDGTSCRPALVSPAEFDARRHWRALHVEPESAEQLVDIERLAVVGLVLAFHVALGLWMARALVPPHPIVDIPSGLDDQVMVVRFARPRPERPAEVPEPPEPPSTPRSAPTRTARPEPTRAEPPASAAQATPEPSAARLQDALSLDLRQQWSSPHDKLRAPTRGFDRPAGQALGEIFDRPVELPGTRSRLDGVWVPDRESLLGEVVRRTTIEREFKDPWGGRVRCAVSALRLGIVGCAFGLPQEPLRDAPLAPNEAPRDGRVPLGTPRP